MLAIEGNFNDFKELYPEIMSLIKSANEGSLDEIGLKRILELQDLCPLITETLQGMHNSSTGNLSTLIAQQSDDPAQAIWNWFYDRQPITISVSFEMLACIYFARRPAGIDFAKYFFYYELLGFDYCEKERNEKCKSMLADKFPFLLEMVIPAEGVMGEDFDKLVKQFAAKQSIDKFEIRLEWSREQ